MNNFKLKFAITWIITIVVLHPSSSQNLFNDIVEVEIGVPVFSIKKYNLRDQVNSGLQGGFWGYKFSLRINSRGNKYYEIGYDSYLQRTNFDPFEKGEYFFVYEIEKINTIQLKRGIKKKKFGFEYGIHYCRQIYKRSRGFTSTLPDPINEDIGVSFDIQYHVFSFLSIDWTNRVNLFNINEGNAGGLFSGVTSLGCSIVIN
jgi:hypothetical protein